MADQPTNIPQSFAGLQEAFLPDRAANVNKTIQFNFTGAEESVWRLVIANGAQLWTGRRRGPQRDRDSGL